MNDHPVNEDDVLRRMLATPPTPHKSDAAKTDKSQSKKRLRGEPIKRGARQ